MLVSILAFCIPLESVLSKAYCVSSDAIINYILMKMMNYCIKIFIFLKPFQLLLNFEREGKIGENVLSVYQDLNQLRRENLFT